MAQQIRSTVIVSVLVGHEDAEDFEWPNSISLDGLAARAFRGLLRAATDDLPQSTR